MLSTGFDPLEIRQKRRFDNIAVLSNGLSFCTDDQPLHYVRMRLHGREIVNPSPD